MLNSNMKYKINIKSRNISDLDLIADLQRVAKKYNKDNRSNYPKQLLAEILINRDCFSKKVIKNISGNPETYGILLSFDNKKTDKIYDFLKDHITLNDWNNFGNLYNCKYVFLYDETGKVLYFQEWKDFLSFLNPQVY